MQEFAPCHIPSGEVGSCLGQTDAPTKGQTTERQQCTVRLPVKTRQRWPPPFFWNASSGVKE